jgi:translation initiation factor 2B subunit (eIF-2B alpha/beta/delta family)
LTFENFCQDGYKTAQELSEAGVPAEIVHDVAVGFVMQEADIVLTGAETLNPKPDPRNPKP